MEEGLRIAELGDIPFDEKEILRYAMLPSFAPRPEELPLQECLERVYDMPSLFDGLTEAEADMVKVVGRQYAAHKVTGPGRFVNVKKAAAVTT